MSTKDGSAPGIAHETSPRKWPFVSQWRELCQSTDPKDFWAGVQSIVVVIAIIGGAVWTANTFWTLGSVNRARAELEGLELQNVRNRAQKFNIELTVEATQLKPPPGDKNHYVSIVVMVKNIGIENIVVCFEDPDENLPTNCPSKDSDSLVHRRHLPPITLAHVKTNPALTGIDFDAPIFAESWREDDLSKQLKGLDIRVGQTESLSSLVRLKDIGIYRIAFSTRQPRDVTIVAPNLKSIWSITKFFVVRENSEL